MIIALDGPAASGKGTLGKRLAAHFGLRHLDTVLCRQYIWPSAEPTCPGTARAASGFADPVSARVAA